MKKRSILILLSIFCIIFLVGCYKSKTESVDKLMKKVETHLKNNEAKEANSTIHDIKLIDTKNLYAKQIEELINNYLNEQTKEFLKNKKFNEAINLVNSIEEKISSSHNCIVLKLKNIEHLQRSNEAYIRTMNYIKENQLEEAVKAFQDVIKEDDDYNNGVEKITEISKTLAQKYADEAQKSYSNNFYSLAAINIERAYNYDKDNKDVIRLKDFYIQKNQEDLNKKKQEELKEKKKSEGVRIGMTKQDVLDSSWGKPEKINKTTTKYGVREQWVYGNGNYLYFEDDKLTSVQN